MCKEITGRVFESATFGACKGVSNGYAPWRSAMEEARRCQPQCRRPAAQRLEAEVRRQCGTVVVFYTAVQSALDYFHGVYGFFEYRGVIVTIDLTTNPYKCTGKADLVVQADDFENLAALATRIVQILRHKQATRH